MRIANLAGRLVVIVGDGVAVDVARASDGSWPADPQVAFEHWASFRAWAATTGLDEGAGSSCPHAGVARPAYEGGYADSELAAPVPRPRQVFAIGLNYQEHADEAALAVGADPAVFTKFPSSITGPQAAVELPDGDVDWEVEIVAAIGRGGHRIAQARAWEHVAGLTVGQDLSERRRQFAGDPPQFSMGKSFPGFAPMGPVLVTADDARVDGDLELGCALNGQQLQKGWSSQMVRSIPALVSQLSHVVALLPGDVIFTGTPAGVGMSRSPRRFLAPGDELVSYVAGIGELSTTFVNSTAEGARDGVR